MEIVYTSKFNDYFKNNKVNNFYGDIHGLINIGIKIEGIIYDDDIKVKKFLGHHKNNKDILEYLGLNIDILDKKIKDLSKTDFKWILLAYVLIKKYKYIIFDYFDYGLIYKDKKKLVRIIKELSNDFNIIVISKDLEFLNNLDKNIIMSIDDEVIEGNIIDLLKDNKRLFEVPDIIEFINMANKRNANLEYTLDRKELLKDIYRGVV